MRSSVSDRRAQEDSQLEGTGVLDLGLGILLSDGDAIPPLLYISNGDRILAGVLGGGLEARGSAGARR
jgi:hypothetical protein